MIAHIFANHCHLFSLHLFTLLSLNTSIRLLATLTVASAGGRLVPSISPLLVVGPSIMLNACRFVNVVVDIVDIDVDLQSVDVVVDCGSSIMLNVSRFVVVDMKQKLTVTSQNIND